MNRTVLLKKLAKIRKLGGFESRGSKYVEKLDEIVNFTVMYNLLTAEKKAKTTKARGIYRCREYSEKNAYVSLISNPNYFCVKMFDPDLYLWFVSALKCYDIYKRYRGIGFYGVMRVYTNIPEKTYRRIEDMFKKRYPNLYRMLNAWWEGVHATYKSEEKDVVTGVVSDFDFIAVSKGIQVCPSIGFLYMSTIRTENGGTGVIVIYSGLR